MQLTTYERRFAHNIARVHGWGICTHHGIPLKQSPHSITCHVCGDDMTYPNESTYYLQWLSQYNLTSLRIAMDARNFPNDMLMVQMIEWTVSNTLRISLNRLSLQHNFYQLTLLLLNDFMRSTTEFMDKHTQIDENALWDHVLYTERLVRWQSTLTPLWEMDTTIHENHIQWLPRELLEETIELLSYR